MIIGHIGPTTSQNRKAATRVRAREAVRTVVGTIGPLASPNLQRLERLRANSPQQRVSIKLVQWIGERVLKVEEATVASRTKVKMMAFQLVTRKDDLHFMEWV